MDLNENVIKKNAHAKWCFRKTNRKSVAIQPFEKHILNDSDPYIKELYLGFLGMIAFLDRDIKDAEYQYLQALCDGIGIPDFRKFLSTLHSYKDRFQEALTQFKKSGLAIWILIDAILLCRIDDKLSKDESEMLGRLAEACGLSGQQVQWCIGIVNAIITSDYKCLASTADIIDDSFPLQRICECYMCSWLDKTPYYLETSNTNKDNSNSDTRIIPKRRASSNFFNNSSTLPATKNAMPIEPEIDEDQITSDMSDDDDEDTPLLFRIIGNLMGL